MNRKLRNTILAFSVTGTVLALGLLAARPLTPGHGETPTPYAAAAATDPATGRPDHGTGHAHAAGTDPDAAAIDDIEARILARSRQLENDVVKAASLESAMALAAGSVAIATTEAVIAEILSGDIPATTGANRADPETTPAPRHRRSVRGAFAVPYFSFARGTGRGGRS